ncbi:hypothetical protein C0416_05355 [bacterium]|nr:hypothetical protein [bacterium]
MYTKHNYFDTDISLIGERYFVYQDAPKAKQGQTEAQESTQETKTEPEKQPSFEEAKAKFDNLKLVYGGIKNDLPKDHSFHNKIKEIEIKIKNAEKLKEDKKREIVEEVLKDIEEMLSPAQESGTETVTETPEQTAKRINGVMREMDDRIDFLEARKNVEPEFEELSKEIKSIQAELAQILKTRKDQTPEGAAKINELMLAYKKAMDRVGVIWNAPPSKPKKEPKEEPKKEAEKPADKQDNPKVENKSDKKEVVPTEPKEKLVFMLGKVLDEGSKAFDKYSKEIKTLIESLNIQPGPEDKAVIFDDLPGDFKIAHVKWPANSGRRPNFVVFKGDETICYTQDEGNNKTSLVHAQKLGPNERPDSVGRRIAEVVKGHAVLPERLSRINFKGGTDRMFFESPSALNDFKSTLLLMAKVTDLNKLSWNGIYEGGKEVHFARYGNSGEGVYKIILRGDVVLYFDTKNPNQIGVQSKNKNGEKVTNYRDASTFILSPKDQKRYEREEEIRKEREKAPAPQVEQAPKVASEEVPSAPEVENAQEFVNEKYKSLVANSGKDFIKIIDGKADKKGMVNKVKIHELLNLDSFGNQVVTVTIKGAPGKPEREGYYWPEDDTFFEIKDGKHTTNRVKFYNGDTLSFYSQSLPEEDAEPNKDHIRARETFSKIKKPKAVPAQTPEVKPESRAEDLSKKVKNLSTEINELVSDLDKTQKEIASKKTEVAKLEVSGDPKLKDEQIKLLTLQRKEKSILRKLEQQIPIYQLAQRQLAQAQAEQKS